MIARSDADARAAVEEAVRAGRPLPVIGLLGGDLARTCGAAGLLERLSDGGAVLPVDLGVADLDGVRHHFVAHVVARRSWWFGPASAVMNAQFLGSWDVAPRGHPNDGRLDVVELEGMSLRQRRAARRRLPTGTHVPHPAIVERRVERWETRFDPPRPVWLDGVAMGRVRTLAVHLVPDGVTVVV